KVTQGICTDHPLRISATNAFSMLRSIVIEIKGLILLALMSLGSLAFGGSRESSPYFIIRVVDEQTGRGVPLVQLKTVSEAVWWTDSAGVVAFEEPGLMGQEVFFHVNSPGY